MREVALREVVTEFPGKGMLQLTRQYVFVFTVTVAIITLVLISHFYEAFLWSNEKFYPLKLVLLRPIIIKLGVIDYVCDPYPNFS